MTEPVIGLVVESRCNYHAPLAYPVVQVIAVAFYLVTTWVCIFWNARIESTPDLVRSRFGVRTGGSGAGEAASFAAKGVVDGADI